MGGMIRYILLTASRDRLYMGLITLFLVTAAISMFIGNTSLVEQSNMSLALMAGTNRLVLMVGLTLFICFHIHHTFERREIDMLMSRPIARSHFVLACSIGFTCIGLFLIVPIILLFFMTTSPNIMGLGMWTLSLVAEVIIVTNFALLTALIMSSAVSAVLVTLSFYFISRMMALFVATIQIPVSIEVVMARWQGMVEAILTFISIFIPRLDLFTQSEWLVYGIQELSALWVIPTQLVIFFPIILLMAVYDIRHKEF